MSLKYRIKKWDFLNADSCYTAQYRIFFMWLNINQQQIGRFCKSGTIFCETFGEAKRRIDIHIMNMKRAGESFYRKGEVVYYEG